jgi:hypothetical protein
MYHIYIYYIYIYEVYAKNMTTLWVSCEHERFHVSVKQHEMAQWVIFQVYA